MAAAISKGNPNEWRKNNLLVCTAVPAASPYRHDADVLEIPVGFEGALEGEFLHVVEGYDPDVSPGAVPTGGSPGLYHHLRHFLRVGEALWPVFHVRKTKGGRGHQWIDRARWKKL